ncbi:MAG TPA: hypothetical protein ENJ11_09260 [Gammaproteobacteria bacterium]|nr:hypothetical protein [Gammaproteobacteria bacterium]
MLQAINDRIKGWLGIAIVILIGLPFALWGIQSYLDDSGPKYAAKVNDIEISAAELDRTVSRQRQQLLKQYGGKLPFDEKFLRKQVLDQLINQRLLEDYSYTSGYRVSDLMLSERIKQQFSVDGVFDRKRFEMIINSNGMSVPMYEMALRSEMQLQQMRGAIAGSAFATRGDVQRLAMLDQQTRDISVLTFNLEHYSTAAKPTAEEIKAYYDENRDRFMVPEKVRVDYVEISSDNLASDIQIDEAQISKMYDDYVKSVSRREERKARHILVNAGEDKAAARTKIEALQKQLEQGADFAELAKKNSDDTGSAANGGELGWIALGEMVKPFETTLFDMEKGKVSDIVETQFGYHLILLEDIRKEKPAPLEVKRYEFEDELKTDAVSSMFYDQSERLATLAYENPDSLDIVAEDMGLKVETTDFFSRNRGEGIAADDKLRNTAFSPLVLEEGSNSDIIEISPKQVVVIRLREHVPASPIPLEQVRSKIENILKAQNGHKQTLDAALAVKQRLANGESVAKVMENIEGVRLDTVNGLGRNDSSKVADPAILRAAFEINPAADGVKVTEVDLMTGDVALVVVDKVNLPETVAEDVRNRIKSEVASEQAVAEITSSVQYIKDIADIEKNKRLLEQE